MIMVNKTDSIWPMTSLKMWFANDCVQKKHKRRGLTGSNCRISVVSSHHLHLRWLLAEYLMWHKMNDKNHSPIETILHWNQIKINLVIMYISDDFVSPKSNPNSIFRLCPGRSWTLDEHTSSSINCPYYWYHFMFKNLKSVYFGTINIAW